MLEKVRYQPAACILFLLTISTNFTVNFEFLTFFN